MRESLFERLKKEKVDFLDSLYKINELLYQSYSDCYSHFDLALKKSVYNASFISVENALYEIMDVDDEMQFYINSDDSFSELLRQCKMNHTNITLNSFLDYLEFFKNLSTVTTKYWLNDGVSQIIAIVNDRCEKLGYEFYETKINDYNYLKLKLKNPSAEIVSSYVNKTTREKIYRYLSIRFGKISEKRECIKSLADDIEEICKKYSNITEYDKLKQFIQCVRHTKEKPKKEFPFYYEDEEKWLDNIFEMIIGILAFTRNKAIVKEIIDLENKAGDK